MGFIKDLRTAEQITHAIQHLDMMQISICESTSSAHKMPATSPHGTLELPRRWHGQSSLCVLISEGRVGRVQGRKSHNERVSIAVAQPLHDLMQAGALPQHDIWRCPFHLHCAATALDTAAYEKAVCHKEHASSKVGVKIALGQGGVALHTIVSQWLL